MDLTIAAVGSPLPHAAARHLPLSGEEVHLRDAAKPSDPLEESLAPLAGTGDVRTEYDQFGHFGPDDVASVDGRETSYPDVAVDTAETLQSADVTMSQPDPEYGGPLTPDSVYAENAATEHPVVPAGVPEQVRQLYDAQYRWAVEIERRALVGMQGAEPPRQATLEVTATERSSGTSGSTR